MDSLLRYTNVLNAAKHYLVDRLLGNVFEWSAEGHAALGKNSLYLPEYHLVLEFS